MNFTLILEGIAVLGAMGAIFGALLAFAAKIFYVEVDPKQEAVRECLAGANCGGCGYPGCGGCAEAILAGKAPVTACAPAGPENAAKDCQAAMLFGGKSNKECRFACIGLGNCAKACKFGAMHIVNGVAKVDRDKCVGCMACADACPKKIIERVPYKQAVLVGCRNQDKGAVTRKICDVGCIGCMKCQRECPAEAIKIENFVSTIDYDKCVGCGHCADICPRGIINLMDLVKQ